MVQKSIPAAKMVDLIKNASALFPIVNVCTYAMQLYAGWIYNSITNDHKVFS